jgi:3-oxoacyl-[acyl-carrier protein] reductase
VDLGLQEKVAVITGAGSQIGFGKGIALVLAKEGCDIAVTDIDLDGAEKTAEEIRGLGRKAIALKIDVTNISQANDMSKSVLDQLGKIDILVNNAGGSTPPQNFAETVEAKWNKDLDLNLRGVLNCTRAVLPHMVSRGSGKIVNIASVAGLSGQPSGTVYGAAKAGVIAFTQGLAQEVIGSGINVNCIAPGMGATAFFDNMGSELNELVKEMKAANRVMAPEDIGNAVAFLVSNVSRQMVGQCLAVRGTT